MSATETAYDRGYARGIDAASWYFDGNTTDETYRRVLQGIDNGDPEVLDTFPSFSFGEWAGDSESELLGDLADDGYDAEYYDSMDSLAESYLQGFYDGSAEEIERVARYQVEGE